MKSHTHPHRRGLTRRAGLFVLLGLLGASGLYWQARPDVPAQSTLAVKPGVRTVRARSGKVEKTLRLSGTIGPERFASLLAPQLRGSRGGPRAGGGRGGGGGGGGGSSSGGGGGSSSGSGGGSSSSTSSSSTSSSSSSAASASGSSQGGDTGTGAMAGAGSTMSSASGTATLRTALSRFGSSSSSSSSSKSRSTSSSATTPVASGSHGNYSYGSGAGDFSLVLQSVAEAGSKVTKGQVIAEFDRLNMLNRLDDFRNALNDQGASLKTLESDLDVEKKAHAQSIESAKAALDKARLDVKTIPVQSDMEAERLKLAAEEADARYKQLLKEVKLKEASQAADFRIAKLEYDEAVVQFRRIEANVDKMVSKAPIDGIVVMGTTFRGSEFKQIQAGDEVRPGMMFMQVVDPTSMVVNASVNQVDVDSIRIGMKARVKFDAYPDLQVPARIYSVAAMPKSGGSRPEHVKEIPIKLQLEGMDPRVIPDLSVAVDVILESGPGTTLAPLESIFRDAATGGAFVFVRSAAGWERRQIELGPSNNVAAAIRSGVRPGEVLAAEWPIQEKRK